MIKSDNTYGLSEPGLQERVISKIQQWLPPAVVQQVKNKDDLEPLDAIRLLSMLPPESNNRFYPMPTDTLTFPRDHNMHYMQQTEWFYLALNLKTEEGKRIGALSSIVRHAVNPQKPSLFALEKTNQLFRSSFSITIGAEDGDPGKHWYINDTGGLVGMYRPGVKFNLPSLEIVDETEEQEDDEDRDREAGRRQAGQRQEEGSVEGLIPLSPTMMRYVMSDKISGAKLDIYLKVKEPLLLQFPNMSGTYHNRDAGINYMYYSFPYLQVVSDDEYHSTVTLPYENEDEDSDRDRDREAGRRQAGNEVLSISTGAGWLDHQGGTQKEHRGIVNYIDEWKTLLKIPQHRMAWIWTNIQFPSLNIFVSGQALNINPNLVKKEAVFPWMGTIMSNQKTQFFKDGKLTIKAVFKSPSLKNVVYATEVEIAVNNMVFNLKSIYQDQRVFPADQGEIYEGAADAQLMSDIKTIKPKGVGFIENMSFSTFAQLEHQQLNELRIAPLSGSLPQVLRGDGKTAICDRSAILPILTLIGVAILLGIGGYFLYKIKKNK